MARTFALLNEIEAFHSWKILQWLHDHIVFQIFYFNLRKLRLQITRMIFIVIDKGLNIIVHNAALYRIVDYVLNIHPISVLHFVKVIL